MKTFNQTELADLARLAHYLTVTAVEPGISAAADLAPAPTPADYRARRRAAGLCPTCGNVRLTKRERANGYQCPLCTARDEGMGY